MGGTQFGCGVVEECTCYLVRTFLVAVFLPVPSMFYRTESGHIIQTSGAVVVQGCSQIYQLPASYNYTINKSHQETKRSDNRQISGSSVTAMAKSYTNASAPLLDTLPHH